MSEIVTRTCFRCGHRNSGNCCNQCGTKFDIRGVARLRELLPELRKTIYDIEKELDDLNM